MRHLSLSRTILNIGSSKLYLVGAHDITNIGHDELMVMLWANEIFDPNNPDTISGALI